MSSKKIYFAFPQALSYSGQSAASELIIDQLSRRGWTCKLVPIYPLDRSLPAMRRYFGLVAGLIRTYACFVSLLFQAKPVLHLNLGQSLAFFARVAPPYFALRALRPKLEVVISLHGSVFMHWTIDAPEARMFLRFLNSASLITVLGEGQRNKLLEFGITRERIRVVPNTCDLPVLDADAVRRKHQRGDRSPVQVLYLSLLIESKGYPEYLEALELLAKDRHHSQEMHAVVCGPMSFSAYCTRFTDPKEKAQWIEDKVASINAASGPVTAEWICGAQGKAKRELFAGADIFVFPSQFPVEAQPLVLLEALASGCAVITSTVGEIPFTLNARCCRMLEDTKPETIAAEIAGLATNPEWREALAREGLSLINNRYSLQSYADTWEDLFGQLRTEDRPLGARGGSQ